MNFTTIPQTQFKPQLPPLPITKQNSYPFPKGRQIQRETEEGGKNNCHSKNSS